MFRAMDTSQQLPNRPGEVEEEQVPMKKDQVSEMMATQMGNNDRSRVSNSSIVSSFDR